MIKKLETFADVAQQLMALFPQKRVHYRQGKRAALLVQSAF